MEHKVQFEVFIGFFQLDCYFPDYDLYVEIDGSVHFYGTTKHKFLNTVAKRKLLEAAGLSVFYLNWFDCVKQDDSKPFEFF